MAETVDFLGHRVSAAGIAPLPQKVLAIKEFPKPSTPRRLREFLGIVNYYHRFIPHATDSLAPLNDLLKGTKNLTMKSLEWTQEAVVAFSSIKTSLADVTLLAHLVPTILTTDTSSEAGEVLQ